MINFNPRSQRRERLLYLHCYLILSALQSTLPAKGATNLKYTAVVEFQTSIHAPSEGSDASYIIGQYVYNHTSIHAPSEGSD